MPQNAKIQTTLDFISKILCSWFYFKLCIFLLKQNEMEINFERNSQCTVWLCSCVPLKLKLMFCRNECSYIYTFQYYHSPHSGFFLCGKLDKSFRLLTLGNSSVKLKIDCRKINWIEREARLNRSGHDLTKKKIKSWFVIAVNPVKESNVHCMLNFVTSPQFWLSILLFNFFYLDKWYYRIAIESVHVG